MGDLELLIVVFFIAMYLMRLAGTLEHKMTPAQRETFHLLRSKLRMVKRNAPTRVVNNANNLARREIHRALSELRPTETGKPTIRVSVYGKNWNVNKNFWNGVKNGYKYNFERQTYVPRVNRPRPKNNGKSN